MKATVLNDCIGLVLCTASDDLCTRLCEFDGPAICTGGSWTKADGVCHGYLYRKPASAHDYRYHTTPTNETCPSGGAPVRSAEVHGLIYLRTAVVTTQAPTTTTRTPFIVHSATGENQPEAYFLAYRLAPLIQRHFGPSWADREVSWEVLERLGSLQPGLSAEDQFVAMHGESLIRLANLNLESRPIFHRPIMILLAKICESINEECASVLSQIRPEERMI